MPFSRPVIDPVCGRTLDADSATAERAYDGRTFHFCSTACLHRFTASPAHYATSLARGDGSRELGVDGGAAPR